MQNLSGQIQLRTVFLNLKTASAPIAGDIIDADIRLDILDFMAMLDGIKPVFVLGRGLDNLHWVSSVLEIARSLDLDIQHGPLWDATPFSEFPVWYSEYYRDLLKPFRAHYIFNDPQLTNAVLSISDTDGRLSITEEARLLGYPICCVMAHYDRSVRYHRATLAMLKRLGGGDEGYMRSLLVGNAALSPQTEAEIANLESALEITPTRYGSWNLCRTCARSNVSPSSDLSNLYYKLATRVDPEWEWRAV